MNFNGHFGDIQSAALFEPFRPNKHHSFALNRKLSKLDNIGYRASMIFLTALQGRIIAVTTSIIANLKTNKNVTYSLLGNAAPIIFALIFIPSIRVELGELEFGALVLIWALIGYFGIFDLGISKALVYHAAKIADNPDQSLTSIVGISVKVIFLLTSLGGLGLYLWAEEFCRLFLKVDAASMPSIVISFQIVAVAIPFTTIGNALRGVLEGLSNFKTASAIKAATFSAYFYVPALLIPFDQLTLANTSIGYLLIRILSCGWSWTAVKQSPAYFRRQSADATAAPITEIFSYGLWALVTAIISPLMTYGDRFVVSSVLGASLVAIYAILQETVGRSLIVSSSYCAVLQPKFTRADAELRKSLYKKSELIMLLAMGLMYMAILAIIKPVLGWWLNDDMSAYFGLMGLFVAALFFNSMAQLPYALLLGRGRPDLVAKAHAVEFLFYVPLCWFATQHFGLQGAAAAWLLRVSFDYGILRWLAKKTGF